jgi:hypothetical protein
LIEWLFKEKSYNAINEFEKMYSNEKRMDGVRYAKDLKDRYTVLWMYEQVK